jgi:predicted Zn-dependent protease
MGYAWLALPLALTLVSVQEEIDIGRQANAQVKTQLAELHQTDVVGYVTDLGRRLTRVAPGPKYPYTFAVADYREINAFALPGGPIWINRGALQMAANESQVAGVLAHEIAHVAQRHAADQLTKTMIARWGIALLGGLLGNVGGAGTAQIAAGLLAGGAFLEFSREDEREADRVGLEILTRAGWDGRGMTELLEILRRQSRRDPDAVEVFLSTHPSPQERIRDLQAAVARRHGGRRDSARFAAIKARLNRMPAAAPMPRP